MIQCHNLLLINPNSSNNNNKSLGYSFLNSQLSNLNNNSLRIAITSNQLLVNRSRIKIKWLIKTWSNLLIQHKCLIVDLHLNKDKTLLLITFRDTTNLSWMNRKKLIFINIDSGIGRHQVLLLFCCLSLWSTLSQQNTTHLCFTQNLSRVSLWWEPWALACILLTQSKKLFYSKCQINTSLVIPMIKSETLTIWCSLRWRSKNNNCSKCKKWPDKRLMRAWLSTGLIRDSIIIKIRINSNKIILKIQVGIRDILVSRVHLKIKRND